MCITPEIAAERRPETTAALAEKLARTRLEQARANSPALREALAAKLGDIEPNRSPGARVVPERAVANFSLEAVSLSVEPGITLPIIILKPAPLKPGARLPAVLAFAQEGKSGFLANRAPEIVKLLENGVAICLPDVRGTGETTTRQGRNPGGMSASANELMLANTLLGSRLKDARTIFSYLAHRADIDSRKIALWGDSFSPVNPRDMLFDKSPNQPAGPEISQAEPLGPLLALMTALYEPEVPAVATRRGIASYLSVLEDRFTYVPLDIVVPGILEAADIADIASAIAPRPVLIQAPVDGRNRPLTLSELKVKAAPRSTNATLREDPTPAIIADWMLARLQ
jgi:hypothetical protein